MRVGIICPYSLTLPGGVQNQVLGLSRSLRARGIDARVLAPCDGAPPDAGVTPLGASIPTAANGSVAPLAPDPACQLRTIRALRDEAFDVVHLHEPIVPGPTMTAGVLAAAPMVGTFHAAGVSAAYRYGGPLVRWLAGRLDHRCAVSPEAAALARGVLGRELELVFNGVEIADFLGAKAHPTAGPTVFFCGRHEQRKGLAVLLEAMRWLPPEVTLWIGGDGPETETLRARYQPDERIHWLGRLSEEAKIARLRGADVFCAPSLHGESFGIVLLEAMAAETPVVASDIPGYANVARSGADALLTQPGDAAGLASALSRALYEPGLTGTLVASGLERAEQLSMDRLADRYSQIYDDLVTARARRRSR